MICLKVTQRHLRLALKLILKAYKAELMIVLLQYGFLKCE